MSPELYVCFLSTAAPVRLAFSFSIAEQIRPAHILRDRRLGAAEDIMETAVREFPDAPTRKAAHPHDSIVVLGNLLPAV
ncbi:uncharacterized protein PHACADRAFT_248765 [Phanerochaete carnosa HHB-10118-sp]|uniref:Uncharacterized protein n=1 Tax=Phanerochaete carnosa (strain HHB-10118-sp) TaxID=650164 RepID=K5WRK6_PHACS|nr:uncharacterized protein PHACADRAFT_248765 [Phanerochaete carnosa HHB-10118-sp]EKM61869.1 hypothetical protein PHACADRAFT_248765 [Phanerochaete carnosa HHB-10118-sp]